MNWFLVNAHVKTKYRKSILEARNALSSSEVLNLSSQIMKIADEKLALTDVKTLGSYFAANNEVDMENLNNNRRELNHITTYPVIGPNQSMKFIALRIQKGSTKINSIYLNRQMEMKLLQ